MAGFTRTAKRNLQRFCLALAATTAIGSVAQAQLITSRIVSFGDSLSDNGNLFAVSGQPPAPYNKRFTNDLTWVEYLGGPMVTAGAILAGGGNPNVAGNLNFAFGGSRTDSLATPGPGIQTQINGFQASGGTFGAKDIVTLWGGANDIFQGIPVAAGNPATAVATMTGIVTAAGNNIGNEVKQLISLGAKTIIVNNLPDFSSLPQFAGGPAAQLSYYSSSTFNSVLKANLTAVAGQNSGVNIVSIDSAKIFNAVIANPALFGITNTTQACVTVLACVTGSKATQNTFLFWDSVHPTQTGQTITALAVFSTLNAGQSIKSVSAFGDIGFEGRRASMLGAYEEFNRIPRSLDKPQFFVSLIGDQIDRDGSGARAKYSNTSGGIRFGGVRSIDQDWRLGLALHATTGSGKSGDITFSPTQLGTDLMVGYVRGPYFVNAGIGANFVDFGDYKRKLAGLPWQNTAQVRGYNTSASVEAGVHYALNNVFELTPQARLAYLNSNINSFNELGNVANLHVASRSTGGLTGALELKGTAKLSDTAKLNAIIGYEGLLAGSSDALRSQLIDNTALPFSNSVKKVSSAGFIFGLGGELQLSSTWSANANYRGSVSGSLTHHQGNIGMNAKF